jgi:CheY-like chemotaxis protein
LPGPALKATVLLVEDHPDVSVVAADYLEHCGCKVVRANSAEVAIDALNKRNDINLVLSDIVMPSMSGLELGRLLREYHPEIPVILACGYSDKAAVAIIITPSGPHSVTIAMRDCKISAVVILRTVGHWSIGPIGALAQSCARISAATSELLRRNQSVRAFFSTVSGRFQSCKDDFNPPSQGCEVSDFFAMNGTFCRGTEITPEG